METLKECEGLGQIIIETAQDFEYEIHYNYSGRSMYGEKCFGISGSFSNLAAYISQVTQVNMESKLDNRAPAEFYFRTMRMDQLGSYSIFYWPGLYIEKEDESDENN